MLAKRPCHTVEVLWREDGPDEEVGAQECASRHDKSERCSGEKSKEREMLMEVKCYWVFASRQLEKE